MKLKFTPSELDIILHRLTVPDALADCLSDTFDWGWNECYEVACKLEKQLNKCPEINFETLPEVEKEILRDCLDGSTYFGSIEDALASGEITKGKYMSMFKAAQSLEKKFESVGLKAKIPFA